MKSGERRLRVGVFHVQPVLWWDDGENLSPMSSGLSANPVSLTFPQLCEFVKDWPTTLLRLEAEARAKEPQ